jgi:hypothetical protein
VKGFQYDKNEKSTVMDLKKNIDDDSDEIGL